MDKFFKIIAAGIIVGFSVPQINKDVPSFPDPVPEVTRATAFNALLLGLTKAESIRRIDTLSQRMLLADEEISNSYDEARRRADRLGLNQEILSLRNMRRSYFEQRHNIDELNKSLKDEFDQTSEDWIFSQDEAGRIDTISGDLDRAYANIDQTIHDFQSLFRQIMEVRE